MWGIFGRIFVFLSTEGLFYIVGYRYSWVYSSRFFKVVSYLVSGEFEYWVGGVFSYRFWKLGRVGF